MGTNYNQLSLEERCAISSLYKEGKSVRQIGAALGRSPSTVAREIKRNASKTKDYEPSYAQLRTSGRRWRGSRLERQPELRTTVLDLLAMGWSPQQVVGRLAKERGLPIISHESIYRFIDTQLRRTKDYKWRHYLPRGKSKRGCRGRKGGSSSVFIKERRSIHERAKKVQGRKEAGHWEADLMCFSKHGEVILATHERHSRFMFLFKQKNKHAQEIAKQMKRWFSVLPESLAKTVTFDNGTEFAEHHQLHALGVKTYFCDTHSPWQKGGIENAIGRFRRRLPRKTDLSGLSNKQLYEIIAQYNHTPRKCLNFQTPAEVFYEQLLHFKCETTSRPSPG